MYNNILEDGSFWRRRRVINFILNESVKKAVYAGQVLALHVT